MTQPIQSARLLSKFVAYQRALDALELVAVAVRAWRGWGDLADQARRCSTSVVLNLAEGNGEPPRSPARRRFQRMALDSALELEGALDVAELGLGDTREVAKAQALASRVAAILTKLCRPG